MFTSGGGGSKGRLGSFTANGGAAGHPGGVSVAGCRCCFPPDTMFEDACTKIVSLGFCSSMNAQKFVRLCGGGSGTMQLSKGKAKKAVSLGKDGPLTLEQVCPPSVFLVCGRAVRAVQVCVSACVRACVRASFSISSIIVSCLVRLVA